MSWEWRTETSPAAHLKGAAGAVSAAGEPTSIAAAVAEIDSLREQLDQLQKENAGLLIEAAEAHKQADSIAGEWQEMSARYENARYDLKKAEIDRDAARAARDTAAVQLAYNNLRGWL